MPKVVLFYLQQDPFVPNFPKKMILLTSPTFLGNILISTDMTYQMARIRSWHRTLTYCLQQVLDQHYLFLIKSNAFPTNVKI